MAKALYLTQDGITDHIGQSQIAPYILGLAREGHDIHVVSAEKPGRDALKAKYRELFRDAGIRWSFVRYANRPPLVSSFWMLWRMHVLAKKVARAERPDIIHCRSYLPFEIGIRLKAKYRVKLLLDVRDFWPDLRLETSRLKFVYRAMKRREPVYFAAADHIVTLTRRGADVLRGWYPDAVGGRRENYTVIPCCADFGLFDPDALDTWALRRRREELGLGEGPVLLYLGSLGPDYLLSEMFMLFRELLALRPSARFLFLSNNGQAAVEREAVRTDTPPEAIRFVSVSRDRVPEHIALADLSVVFPRQTPSKAGGSPTKLAELFALNVPVIANSGVGDMDAIIDYARNGSVIVPDFEPGTLRRALQQVIDPPDSRRKAIRDTSFEFSLEEGVRRYDRIYRGLA